MDKECRAGRGIARQDEDRAGGKMAELERAKDLERRHKHRGIRLSLIHLSIWVQVIVGTVIVRFVARESLGRVRFFCGTRIMRKGNQVGSKQGRGSGARNLAGVILHHPNNQRGESQQAPRKQGPPMTNEPLPRR